MLLILSFRYFHDKPLETSALVSMLSVFLSLIITLRKEIHNTAKLISNDAMEFIFEPQINAWISLDYYNSYTTPGPTKTIPPLMNRGVMNFGGRPGSATKPLIFFVLTAKKYHT